jgi:molybdopterin converting factor small subunit
VKQVRFLSYLRTLTGVSRYNLKSNPDTVADALKEIANTFPQIRELILDDVPEVSFILGDRTLVTPKDLSLILSDELIIGPIISGG